MYKWERVGETGNFSRTGTAHMPPGVVSVIGGGTTSLVGLLEDGTILKYPIVEGECSNEFNVEAAIYKELGNHPRIIGFLGQSMHGLKLERGDRLTEYIDTVDDPALKLQWARQTAEGLSFLHSRGVIHCDLHPDNLLLDEGKNIKICDFQGKMEGLDGAALERIMTGSDPYQDIPENDVPLKYEQLDFPATDFTAGPQVLKCWQQEYSCADEVVSELASLHLFDI
ncbi:hypothetical protein LTR17_026660 [Elasticomyces elasticus]|nr:hypothetical protein LTR17_026660 [Elasticomyces elasticus]